MSGRGGVDARLRLAVDLARELAAWTGPASGLVVQVTERLGAALGGEAAIWLASPDGPWLEPARSVYAQPAAERAAGVRWPVGQGLRGTVLASDRGRLSVGVAADGAGGVCVSQLHVPLRAQGGVVGVLEIVRFAPGPPHDEADLHLAEDLAAPLSLALAALRVPARTTPEAATEGGPAPALALRRPESELIARMSHELRTPLNAILGFAALMQAGRAGPVSEVHREYLGDILGSGRRLLQLVNDVLDVAKVDSGRMEVRPEVVDPARLAGRVLEVLGLLSRERQIEVTVAIDPALATVTVDARMLEQVLYNYLSNALKFTAERGRVALRMSPEGEGAFRIDVEDSGVGIQAHDLPRLFRDFQQIEQAPRKRYPGAGLGLALTRRVVEAQGGRVEVASVWGAGSTFSAILPRVVVARPARTGVVR